MAGREVVVGPTYIANHLKAAAAIVAAEAAGELTLETTQIYVNCLSSVEGAPQRARPAGG